MMFICTPLFWDSNDLVAPRNACPISVFPTVVITDVNRIAPFAVSTMSYCAVTVVGNSADIPGCQYSRTFTRILTCFGLVPSNAFALINAFSKAFFQKPGTSAHAGATNACWPSATFFPTCSLGCAIATEIALRFAGAFCLMIPTEEGVKLGGGILAQPIPAATRTNIASSLTWLKNCFIVLRMRWWWAPACQSNSRRSVAMQSSFEAR